jgi:hypothetical protein
MPLPLVICFYVVGWSEADDVVVMLGLDGWYRQPCPKADVMLGASTSFCTAEGFMAPDIGVGNME